MSVLSLGWVIFTPDLLPSIQTASTLLLILTNHFYTTIFAQNEAGSLNCGENFSQNENLCSTDKAYQR